MPTIQDYRKQKEKEAIAFNYFTGQGYSPEASAGIVGNLVYESGLNTKAEGDKGFKNGSSFGIGQFRGKRLENLKKRYGDKWTDFENQLDFVRYELETTHQRANNALKNSTDVYQAGSAFSDLYEIPAKKYKDNTDRQKKVNNIYNSFVVNTSNTPISDAVISQANDYFNRLPTTTLKDLPSTEETVNFTPEEDPTETEKTKDKDIEEVEQKTKEYNFLQEYQALVNKPQEQVVQQDPIQQVPQQNFQDIYNQVSDFVDTPFQQGGKVYVNSTNDPRYKAYQDSLKLYQGTQRTIEELKSKRYAEEGDGKVGIVPTNALNTEKKQALVGFGDNSRQDGNWFLTYDEELDLQNAKKYLKSASIKPTNFYKSIAGSTYYRPIYQKPNQEVEFRRDNLKSINDLNKAGLTNTPNQNIISDEQILNRYIQPKYWEIQDNVNQNFGSTQTNYTVTPESANSMLRTLAPEPYNSRIVTPYFQQGGAATRQDSLNVYNNSRQVENYYRKNKYDRTRRDDDLFDFNVHSLNKDAYNSFINNDKNNRGVYVNNDGSLPTLSPSLKQFEEVPNKDYRKNIDQNKYLQRESANNFLNKNAPLQLFDNRVEPVSSVTFEKNGDLVNIYSYNNIANKPFDLLTPAEKQERVQKYGRQGVPKSYVDKGQIDPPVKEMYRPKLDTLPRLTPTGLTEIPNQDINSDAQILNQYIQPKYWDVQDNVNQNFGSTQTNYRVTSETANSMLRTIAPEPYNTRTATPYYQQGGSVQGSKDFLQNWYQNRELPDPTLNKTYQNEKQQYVKQSQSLPNPNYLDKIDNSNTQGNYDILSGNINLLKSASPYVYTHEGTHAINLPLKDTQSNTTAFTEIGRNIIPQEKIENQWVKENYPQISNYQEVIPRIQAYRQKYNLKPDQVITPELIQQNRKQYIDSADYEDNTDQLYKLFEDQGLSNVLNKVVQNEQNNTYYAQQGVNVDKDDNNIVEESNKWLNNWYAKREIPVESFQKSYLEDKPFFTDRLKNIPEVKRVENIDDNITGRYQGNTNEILLTPSAQKETYLHELDHYANNFPSYSRTINDQIVPKNVKTIDNVPNGVYKEKYKYFTDPDEVHSRIQVLRKNAGIKPDQVVTPEFLKNYLKNYKGDVENVNDLLNITDEPQLLDLLNLMAYNSPETSVKYGQQGQVIQDQEGQRKFPNRVTEIKGNIMATDGYGNIPLLVIPDKGSPQIIKPNTGEYTFDGATKFTEYPLTENEQKFLEHIAKTR